LSGDTRVKRCAVCGKAIEGDWRFGEKCVGGVYLCSEECEKEWVKMMEEREKGRPAEDRQVPGSNPGAPTYIAEIKCKKCGSNKFILRKKIHYEGSLKSALISELLCHDGFGWNVNTFDFVCAKCGAVNEDYVDVQEVIS